MRNPFLLSLGPTQSTVWSPCVNPDQARDDWDSSKRRLGTPQGGKRARPEPRTPTPALPGKGHGSSGLCNPTGVNGFTVGRRNMVSTFLGKSKNPSLQDYTDKTPG